MSYADTATQVAATPGWAVAVLLILLIGIFAILVYEVFIKPTVKPLTPDQTADALKTVVDVTPLSVDIGTLNLNEEDRALLTKHNEALEEWTRLMNAVEVVRLEADPKKPTTTGFEAPPVTSGIMVAVCAACGRKHTEENPIQFDFELMDFLCKEDREDLTAWSSYSPLDSPKEWLAMRQATRDNDITKG